LLLIAVGAAALFLFTGTPLSGAKLKMRDTPVASIELTWFGSTRKIADSNQCSKVIQTLCKARQSPVVTSLPFGSLAIFYTDGMTNRFFVQESGRTGACQLVDETGGYAISMHETLQTFRDVGLLTNEDGRTQP
jgi:hypothetical protein